MIQPRKPTRRYLAGSAFNPVEKSAAAIRAEKFRAKQSPEFKQQEAKRRREQRKAKKQDPKEFAKNNPEFPISLTALQHKNGTPLSITDAPNNSVGVIRLGGGSTELERLFEKAKRKRHGGKTAPSGQGPSEDAKLSNRKLTGGPPPKRTKEIRAMYQFLRGRLDYRPMMVCLECDQQISPDEMQAAYIHFRERHPKMFAEMFRRIQEALAPKKCSEDHERIIKKYHGSFEIQCRKCRKILWKPGDPVPGESEGQRSDTGFDDEIAA